MNHRRIALALLALATPSSVVAAPPHTYAVSHVGSALDEAAVVGRKRAGAFCAPNGAIRWGDVSGGAAMDEREAVQDVLEDAGVPVTPLGAFEGAPRLRALVTAASFDLCAKHWGLGDARSLSGHAALTVEWRLEGDGIAPRTHASAVSRDLKGGEGAPLGAIYRTLLAEAARDAAAWLLANPR